MPFPTSVSRGFIKGLEGVIHVALNQAIHARETDAIAPWVAVNRVRLVGAVVLGIPLLAAGALTPRDTADQQGVLMTQRLL